MIVRTPQINLPDNQRIVITGIGLTSPNGNTLAEYRAALLAGVSGVSKYEVRYFGETLAGIARKLHISRADLAEANGVATSALVSEGQELIVPAGDEQSRFHARIARSMTFVERISCTTST